MKKKKGFTLIELVVVIAIMAILALIIVPNLTAYVNKSDDARILANMKTVHTAAELVNQTERKLEQNQISKLSNNSKVSIDIIKDENKVYGTYYVEKHGDKIIVKHVDKTGKLHFYPEEIANDSGESPVIPVDPVVPDPPTPEPPVIKVAKDSDFMWNTAQYDTHSYSAAGQYYKGYYTYIGTEKEIELPATIKGHPMTSYYSMFYHNKTITKVVSKNTNITNMYAMFNGVDTNELDLSGLNTSGVTNMQDMFKNSNIKEIDLSSFNTLNVDTMESMFENSKTNKIKFGTEYNTSNVTVMTNMFKNSTANQIIGLDNFKTQNVITMGSMFEGIGNISLNLDSFNIQKVSDLSRMFANTKLQNLSLTSFQTSAYMSLHEMFNQSNNLYTVYARNQSDVNRLNSSYGKPSSLTVRIK